MHGSVILVKSMQTDVPVRAEDFASSAGGKIDALFG